MTHDRAHPDGHLASVVIPAHNEGRVIGRLLDALLDPRYPLELVVVCNGCTDDTAAVARSRGGSVRVLELDQPSKRHALRAGDDVALTYPRVFVDADVEISACSVSRLCAALAAGPAIAAAPTRRVPRHGQSAVVRWYYDVWELLPQVRSGLFGRGVIALTEQANRRVRALPPMMGDDLVASEAFGATERTIVEDAEVVVWPPRTVRDLVRRRVRTSTGNSIAGAANLRGAASSTSVRDLIDLVRSRPGLALKVPVFVAFSIAGRLGARKAIRAGDDTTWLRDDSSRTA